MAVGIRELVGREEELASLLALLDARDGLPAVAVVSGEAGIGKTALWLDAPSLAMLRFALSRLETEQIVAILCVRDEVPFWLQRGVPEARLLTIELGPLSVGALHELLRTRVGVVLPRPTLLRIWETSGGNRS